MKLRLVAYALLLAAVACVTPMTHTDIDRLTTCTGKTLAEIRKNLLLAGYGIERETDTDVTTDYKQVGGYGSDRRLRRITVVKVDERTFKFRVRNKEIRIHRDEPGGSVGFGNDRKRQGGTVIIDLSPPVETVQEFDEDYYEESRETHEEMRREVCGGG